MKPDLPAILVAIFFLAGVLMTAVLVVDSFVR